MRTVLEHLEDAAIADGSANKKVNIIVQAGLKKEPELPDVPLVDRSRHARRSSTRSSSWSSSSQEMARPFAAPPGIPADRKARADRGVRRRP